MEDIQEVFRDPSSHLHSSSALRQLQKTKIGRLVRRDTVEHDDQETRPISSFHEDEKTKFEIDPRRSVLEQLDKLNNDEFKTLLKMPVEYDRVRFFKSNALEFLTTIHIGILLVALVLLNVCVMLYSHFELSHLRKHSKLIGGLFILAGLALWSFVEYVLHRWVFHFALAKNKNSLAVKRLQFLIHGFHHALPRLRNKSLFAVMIELNVCAAGWALAFVLLDAWYASFIFVGMVSGVILSELLINFHFHSDNRIFGRLIRKLETLHYNHHYKGECCYSVINPYWDELFNTLQTICYSPF
eukprot:TRINITY_DN3008_c0_g1_i3.p1 TRINITY_DN3008_c0_g1~~TRINITY_DN3008_c0_g1_i3.p1  ORF type:complete len:299 (-),score=70.69 TRINITY_DN3008_c0_g1_i3:256-1152(-)